MRKLLLTAAAIIAATAAEASEKSLADGTTEVVERKIETKQVQLPQCTDKKLHAAVKEFVAGYFAGNADKNVRFRRRRHFITHNLDGFATENVANYKTESTRPVSDVIADVKINKGVAENNLRLCKSQSPNADVKNIYLLIYPEAAAFRCVMINLAGEQKDFPSFTYNPVE